MAQHEVELDVAGFFNSHPRLTCYSCAGATLVRQPYMNDETWQKHVQEFGQVHPSPVVKQLLCSFEFKITIQDKSALWPLITTMPVTPLTVVFFGGDRWNWTSWGVVVMDGENSLAGLITVGDEGEDTGQPTVIGLWVRPDLRRRGLGSVLLLTAIQEAQRRGLLPLCFETLTRTSREFIQASQFEPEQLDIRYLDIGIEILE